MSKKLFMFAAVAFCTLAVQAMEFIPEKILDFTPVLEKLLVWEDSKSTYMPESKYINTDDGKLLIREMVFNNVYGSTPFVRIYLPQGYRDWTGYDHFKFKFRLKVVRKGVEVKDDTQWPLNFSVENIRGEKTKNGERIENKYSSGEWHDLSLSKNKIIDLKKCNILVFSIPSTQDYQYEDKLTVELRSMYLIAEDATGNNGGWIPQSSLTEKAKIKTVTLDIDNRVVPARQIEHLDIGKGNGTWPYVRLKCDANSDNWSEYDFLEFKIRGDLEGAEADTERLNQGYPYHISVEDNKGKKTYKWEKVYTLFPGKWINVSIPVTDLHYSKEIDQMKFSLEANQYPTSDKLTVQIRDCKFVKNEVRIEDFKVTTPLIYDDSRVISVEMNAAGPHDENGRNTSFMILDSNNIQKGFGSFNTKRGRYWYDLDISKNRLSPGNYKLIVYLLDNPEIHQEGSFVVTASPWVR